jgi:hypothetical protein
MISGTSFQTAFCALESHKPRLVGSVSIPTPIVSRLLEVSTTLVGPSVGPELQAECTRGACSHYSAGFVFVGAVRNWKSPRLWPKPWWPIYTMCRCTFQSTGGRPFIPLSGGVDPCERWFSMVVYVTSAMVSVDISGNLWIVAIIWLSSSRSVTMGVSNQFFMADSWLVLTRYEPPRGSFRRHENPRTLVRRVRTPDICGDVITVK